MEPVRLQSRGRPPGPMNRHPISIRPTAAQMAWLKAQRQARGLAINALVLLALERAMAADPVADDGTPQQSPTA